MVKATVVDRKNLAVSVIFAAVAVHQLLSKQFPHGRPVDLALSNRHSGPPMDPSNVSLRLSGGKLTKIYERVDEQGSRLLVGPETIIFDNNGIMYTLTEQSKLVSLTLFQQKREGDPSIKTAKVTEVADLGIGRPLGGKFDSGSCLYFADVLKGLCRICLDQKPKPVVELVASRFQLEDGSWSDVTYADDVDIGPSTGHVYFSDATNIKVDRDLHTGLWDIMYPSKLEAIRGLKSGRLLRYKPETGEVDLLASGAALFANGVAVDAQERFVVLTSTFEGKVLKYHLAGEKKGQLETILTDFPGFLDGIDCSFDSSLCFVAMPAPATPELKALFKIPLSRFIRSILMLLPRALAPGAKPYGGVAVVHPGHERSKPSVYRIYQDPTGSDISVVTGVTEHEGNVYLGSLHNDFIGVLDYQ
jgi:sugar lactone lactonase YvrE